MSLASSEEAREAARQTAEADQRAGTPDYVEARGMLLPATEYFQRAVLAAERTNRITGQLLSLVSYRIFCQVLDSDICQAAESYMSLGNVSYSHHNEQYFQQAVIWLRTASQIPNFQLSPYLQRYCP